MPELTSEQDDLPAVMRFVRHEVRQDVTDIEREVAPDVGWRRRHLGIRLESEREERLDAVGAPREGREQLAPPYATPIDEPWHPDPMRLAECANPASTGVVQVRHEHADGAAWRTGNGLTPEGGGQLLDEIGGDAAIRPPCREHGRPQVA